MEAACKKAETGVGPSIAKNNQVWKGKIADLQNIGKNRNKIKNKKK